MERLHKQLKTKEKGKLLDIIIEGRGKTEDRELELEFRRILDGQQKTFSTNTTFNDLNYRFNIETKQNNIIGLQIADLIARPLGINYLNPTQQNQAYKIIKDKNSINKVVDYEMLKTFP